MQLPADHGGQPPFLQIQGRLIENGQRQILDDAVQLYIAEAGHLVENAAVADRLIAAQHDDIGGDAHALQLLHRVLGGLGLVLSRSLQIGHQSDMDIEGIGSAHLQSHLTDGLDEGLALHIADGAADLGDDHIRIGALPYPINKMLDLVGDMGNGLHGAAQIFAPTLLGDDIGVDLAGGQVGILVQILVDEPLVMSQIQIGLRAVLRHIDLAVLVGAHGAGVSIDIGIQLLRRHLQSPCLQQPPQGRRRDPLAQSGHHAAGHKNILRHTPSSCKK